MFIRAGRRFGPVSIEKIEHLCQLGIITADTPVHSSLFKCWVEAAKVPALRDRMRVGAPPADIEAVLRDIRARALHKPWFELFPLGAASGWAMGAVLAASLVVGAARWYLHSPDPGAALAAARELSAAMGTVVWSFAVALVVGWCLSVIGWLASLRKRSVAIGSFAAGAGLVLACAFAGQLGVFEKWRAAEQAQRQATRQFVADMRLVMQHMVQQKSAAANESDQRIAPRAASATMARSAKFAHTPDVQLVSASQSQRMADLARSIVNDLLMARSRYIAAMKATQPQLMLSPRRLTDRRMYAAARKQCLAAEAALNQFEGEVNAILAAVPARLKASGLSDREQREFLTGFAVGPGRAESRFRQILSLERAALLEVRELLDFVEARIDQVVARDGRLYFATANDLKQYNVHMQNLRAIVADGERLARLTRLHAAQWVDTIASVGH